MTMKRSVLLAYLAIVAVATYSTAVTAFAPIPPTAVVTRRNALKIQPRLQASKNVDDHDTNKHASSLLGTAAAPLALLTALPAHAAADGGGFVLASAFVAYVHYAALLCCVGVLVTERLTVKSDMTFEQEELLWKADALYGIAGLALAVSGYYRTVEYGKGWEFYAHEPLFWLKLALVGIWGASSFFPTIIILQRVLEQRETGEYPRMSEKLADRLTTVINAELLAIASVPLVATFMSRGVLYLGDDFPWQAGAGFVVVTFGGFAFKYVKEALTWSDDDDESAQALTGEAEE